MFRHLVALLLAVVLLFGSNRAFAQESAHNKEEAQSHFDLGLSHFDREEWPAALVEFLKSREMFPSRGNTKNAAICLRKLGRFDEALTLFEALVRDFPDLSPTDRTLGNKEIGDLQASVGTVAIDGAPEGASVTIDGVDRGKTPLKPIRLSAGTHQLRVSKEGSLPFEARIDLTGRQAAVVHARLDALTRVGRLRVSEHSGQAVDVIVDGSLAGKAPWEGALAPGPHTVWLKGEGDVGTPPALATVKLDGVATLDLTAEPLGVALRIELKPTTASVVLDDVPLGRGVWSGRVRPGSHKIEATAEGYGPFVRKVQLANGADETLTDTLELVAVPRGHSGIVIELDLGAPMGLLVGGELASSCTGACSTSFPIGFEGVLHGTYQLGSGLGIGLHGGYSLITSTISDRVTTISSGSREAHGAASDSLLLGGVVAGIDGQFRTRGDWPFTLRLGLGVMIGSMRDKRSGRATDSKGGQFSFSTSQSPSAD